MCHGRYPDITLFKKGIYMRIIDTKRNIQHIAKFKNNFGYSMQIAELEPIIDGAHIDNMALFDLKEASRLLKNFIQGKTGFSDEEYYSLFNPLQRISGFDFMQNPYMENILLKNISVNNIELVEDFYKPHEFVLFDQPTQDKNLLRKYTLGIFDSLAYTYLLKENSNVWMSINPMEINTSKKAISNAHGNVLVLGGGLGYYAYMVSLKENVNKITIVESNSTIKDILENMIIPQFGNNKVSVINDDSYHFLNTYMSDSYNSVFVDTWPDNVKGMDEYKIYVKYENKYPNVAFDYWLEDSILDSVIVNIYQYISAKLGTEDYQKYFSIVAPDLWNYLESVPDEISRPEQISYYLTKQFAKNTLKNI